MKTNNPVTISFVEAVLGEAEIGFLVLDQNMSIMEGSLGLLPRRILVESGSLFDARTLLRDAGLGEELPPAPGPEQ